MNNKGFTLVEMLLVLSIVLVISSVTIIQFKPHRNFLDKHIFLSQFQSDLYYAQQYAISHQEDVIIFIDINQKRYYLRTMSNAPILLERYYPPSVSWRPGSLPLTIKFLPDGNVSQFGSLTIFIGDISYKLTILLGKGRFYIVET